MVKLRRITPTACSVLFGLCLLPSFSSAREIVYLTNGFTLEAASHSSHEGTVVVQTATGTFEVPSATIEHIDSFADPPPLPKDQAKALVANQAKPDLEGILSSAANSQGLTPSFVRSVAKVESNLRPDAVSPVGALGLMQLMPGTAADLGVAPDDPKQNAAGGAQYLRQLLLQYHGDAALALAAYNAGPAAVAKYHGVPPFGETRRYVVRVLQEYVAEQKKAKVRAALLARDSGQVKARDQAKSHPVPAVAALVPVAGR